MEITRLADTPWKLPWDVTVIGCWRGAYDAHPAHIVDLHDNVVVPAGGAKGRTLFIAESET